MMKTIYISGPITDPITGKPRDGWQKDFLNAEAKLRCMGFRVLNPVDIAQEVEDAFKWRFDRLGGPCNGFGEPCPPTRADYIIAYLRRMQMAHDADCLHGIYVIGDENEVLASAGVRMELFMADLLSAPIYAESEENHQVNTFLAPLAGCEGIEELLKD